jgi:two-component system nitrogen regulation response regulator NtrX
LFYRINAVPITVPPLRERVDDIPLLVDRFLDGLLLGNPETRKLISSGAIAILMRFDWPGNVRQLKNVIERLFFTSREATISAEEVAECMGERVDDHADSVDLPSGANRLSSAVNHFERSFLKSELRKTEGNITQLAERLGMDRGNLYRKLKKLGLLSS